MDRECFRSLEKSISSPPLPDISLVSSLKGRFAYLNSTVIGSVLSVAILNIANDAKSEGNAWCGVETWNEVKVFALVLVGQGKRTSVKEI